MAPQTYLSSSPWIQLELDTWQMLLTERKPTFYPKNSYLFRQGEDADFVYIVQKGRFRITFYHQEGMEKQLYIAEKGCLCGENACLGRHPHSTSALAIVDSWVFKIDARELLRAMQADWELNQAVFGSLCRKNNVYLSQIISLSFSQALQRIARHLADLSYQYGIETPDGWCITINFTQSELAQLVNSSRVTVNNAFNLLTARNIIMKKKGTCIIKDLSLLEALASGETEL